MGVAKIGRLVGKSVANRSDLWRRSVGMPHQTRAGNAVAASLPSFRHPTPYPRWRAEPARMPDLSAMPPPARAPFGYRRHRFPRSHGPSEHKVKTPWLTFRCHPRPSPALAPAAPRPAMSTMPKKPETRRTPRESASAGPPAGTDRRRADQSALPHAPRRNLHVPTPGGNTEGTQEPQQCWRFRAGGAANGPAGAKPYDLPGPYLADVRCRR